MLPPIEQAICEEGVRGVVEALVLDGAGNAKVGDAGLDGCGTVLVVDVEDAVELGETEHDPVFERQRAARKPGARHPWPRP